MLEVLGQDYIRTAYAKGLSEKRIIFRPRLKNALLPVVTILGLSLPTLIGGDSFSRLFSPTREWEGWDTRPLCPRLPVVMAVGVIAAFLNSSATSLRT